MVYLAVVILGTVCDQILEVLWIQSIKGQALRYEREDNKSVWVSSGKDRLRSLMMQQSKFRKFCISNSKKPCRSCSGG
ncbi:hypothetical protein RchiOBHm_Chr4g0393901 [Rosa chinensis]|uniref:Uncharacterized protein n=1 Tax=Rosa chinensis TaxID=74649 RepID=A0A2P6QR36_ROSCH|nr:hypothetical protein RchiOBHm_Chr4g0393901 [Rosa chinensis]